MLEGLQNSLAMPRTAGLGETALHLLLAGFLGVYLRFLFRRVGTTNSDAELISRVFPLLTVITTGVISIVRDSAGLALGMLGALSIVRFRAAIKEPEELVYLFLCIAVGLSLGAGQPFLALALVVVATLFVAGMHVAGKNRREHRLMLTITGDSEKYFSDSHTTAFATVKSLTEHCSLQRMDIENGRGQLRVCLPRVGSSDVDSLIVKLRREMPDCEFSYMNMESTL